MLLGLFAIWVSEGLKKSNTFLASALLEPEAGQDTGSCMLLTLKITFLQWEARNV